MGRKKKPKKTDLIPINEADRIIGDLMGRVPNGDTEESKKKRVRFALYRIFGFSQQQAAELAGFKGSYGFKLERGFKSNPKWRMDLEAVTKRMPENYRAFCRLQLPGLAEAEHKAVELMKADPELLLKHPRVSRQIKESAGVLETNQPSQPIVNVGTMQFIQQSIAADFADKSGDGVIDIPKVIDDRSCEGDEDSDE
ncbi:MAG: hypothetical protein ACYSR9_12920 [Planctomycetota bacterium]|jgi:hypothetical protein